MKKYFQFNGTINGTTFFLRNLFVAVLLIPCFILTLFFSVIVCMELMDSAGIDIQEIQESGTFDQKELEAQMEEGFKDNPEEILNIFKNAFTPFWIISFVVSIIPVVWFSLSTYFKRITALCHHSSLLRLICYLTRCCEGNLSAAFVFAQQIQCPSNTTNNIGTLILFNYTRLHVFLT